MSDITFQEIPGVSQQIANDVELWQLCLKIDAGYPKFWHLEPGSVSRHIPGYKDHIPG